jgi:transposase
MRTGVTVELSAVDRHHLAAIVADRNSPQKHVWRAQIVLLTAEGCGTAEIMRRANVSKIAVWRWQERFMTAGGAGLLRDKTRPSRIPPLGIAVEQDVVARTLTDPPGETTHWTAGAMAKDSGISVSSVQRIWRKQGLQPYRTRQFKLSNDPQFAAKLHEIVGLYVDPPDVDPTAHAVVLDVRPFFVCHAAQTVQQVYERLESADQAGRNPGMPVRRPSRLLRRAHDGRGAGRTGARVRRSAALACPCHRHGTVGRIDG